MTTPTKISSREQKRIDILNAASALFLKKGYNDASMDEIAFIAGVAKQTIYTKFESKELLFEQVLDMHCRKKFDILRDAYEKDNLEATLTNFAHSYVDHMASKENIALRRLLCTESVREQKIGDLFFENGPRQSLNEIKEYFDHKKAQGIIRYTDTNALAYLFVFSLASEFLVTDILGSKLTRSKEEIVTSTVTLLIRAATCC